MAKFKNVVITNSGLALITATQNGGTIEFTGLKMGNGIYYGSEVLEDMTALKSVKKTLGITGIIRNGSVLKIRSVVTNEGVTEGYYITEIGLFAKDASGKEILYAIFIAETDRADYFSPYEEFPQSMTLEIYISAAGVDESVTFTASIIEGVYATVEDLEDMRVDVADFRVEVDALKKSVSDGKTLVAGAITAKGVNTATDATFATMATNIAAIKTNPTLQAKTATLSTAAQTIKADSGYDGLSQVTVPEITGTAAAGNVLAGKTFSSASGVNLTGTMANKTGTAEYTATAALDSTNSELEMTIPGNGYYSTNNKLKATFSTIASLIELTSAKLASGNTILGVAGSSNVVDTSAGTATAAQILSGKIAYVDGAKLTGTMANKTGTAEYTATAALDSTNSELEMTIPATGYYSTSNKLKASFSTIASLLGLTSAKLASGNTILGVSGNSNVVDTSEGTASESQILSGQIAYVDGTKLTGTMSDKTATSEYTVTAVLDSTNNELEMTIPAEGYYSTSNKLKASFSSIATLLGLTSEKLASGNSILGVSGNSNIVDTSAGTATAAQILNGKVAYVDGTKLTGTMADKTGTAEYTATAALDATNKELEMTIPAAGYYSTSNKLKASFSTIASLLGLTSAKLASGNTILGISGNSNVVDTSAGTASAAQILSGQIAYVDGVKLTGTMANNGAVTQTLNAGGSYTIPAGYHNGSGKVSANGKRYATGTVNYTTATMPSGTIMYSGSGQMGSGMISTVPQVVLPIDFTPSSVKLKFSGNKSGSDVIYNIAVNKDTYMLLYDCLGSSAGYLYLAYINSSGKNMQLLNPTAKTVMLPNFDYMGTTTATVITYEVWE